jgi:Mlc titration factor MtfA (ptsG expression regulator)
MQIVRTSSLLYTVAMASIIGGGAAVIGWKATPFGAWVGLIPALLIAVWGLRRPLRRWRVARQAFPEAWSRWLRRHIPMYERLSADGRQHFERDVQFFIDEHTFEGIQGVEITDELRLSVAAAAALLLHGRPTWELPGGQSVLLYPGSFDENYFGGDYAEFDGMAHQQGPILLSAQSVRESWATPDDGSNVVLHELAHLFDFENTGADGIPSLINPASEGSWQSLVRKEMKRIRRGKSMLRRYGATAPSEFFAVAVEAFFEQPDEMEERHPELFAALKAFFHLDPRRGIETPAEAAEAA